MFKEVIVVEGIHDHQKLQSIYPDIETIITGGSSVSNETLTFIKDAAKKRGVILFLDPDFPGRQITQKILDFCENETIKIATIERNMAYSKNHKKIGVEHVSVENIVSSLEKVVVLDLSKKSNQIQLSDLIKRQLVQHSQSKQRRKEVSRKLNLPPSNGKTFLKFLNMMSISLAELDKVIK